MLQIVKGVYENGQIVLEEKPAVKPHTRVLVTFLTDEKEQQSKGKQKIILGLLEGKIDTPDDFNEPLEDLKEYM